MKQFTPILLLSATLVTAQVPSEPIASRSADIQTYLAAMKERIAINTQERDPFGLPQQVSAKLDLPDSPLSPKPKATPFADLIGAIPISAIDAVRKEILVGARIFQQGQTFPIHSGQERIMVGIDLVIANSVTFRNLDSGDSVTRTLAIQPKLDTGDPDIPDGVELADPTGGAPLVLP